ncbi:MAG TPA: alginate lyase family protein [Candidatus Aquilonibacter sp.]|nr:alginate lyase family protein [Candidatus Aquilonibacter sp.]
MRDGWTMLRGGAVLGVALLVGFAAIAEPALRSPWDGSPVKMTDAPYACPAVPQIAPDLTTEGFYKLGDPTHSIVDPAREAAYQRSSGPVKAAGEKIVTAADAYRTKGSRAAAECALKHVAAMAQEHSLTGTMSSNQAYYVQGWVAGAVAIAYLKIRDAHLATPEEAKQIADWLVAVGNESKGYFEPRRTEGKSDAHNNHLYWAGVELAAIGVVANNRADFNWAMGTYDAGVDQIRPDGTLPLEMARGQRALHYHLYALAPLVMLAEFGEANGLDLYARDHGAIHRLVNVSIAGLADPSLFVKATGVQQEVPKSVSGDQIGWAPPYVRRFPNAQLSKLIANAKSLRVYYLGGLPPPE